MVSYITSYTLNPPNSYDKNPMDTFLEIMEECLLETGMITKMLMMVKTKFDHMLDHINHI